MPGASHHARATQQAPRGEPLPAPAEEAPSKQNLTSWWKKFNRKQDKEIPAEPLAPKSQGIFGVPLHESIVYAHVAISLTDENGFSYTYGYVPIVVAKCGVYLKEKATETEGIFRIAGAERRVKELQNIFNSPDRFGKGLDWSGYNVNDCAHVLRRFLNQLPEPVIPFSFYHRFREPLNGHQAAAVGEMSLQAPNVGDFNAEEAINTYKALVIELPSLNRHLLLYILDLLAVFSAKSEINLMTASNLAAIFQPGLLSWREHDMSPKEYRWSQDVIIFLVENQDNFVFGKSTAAAEKTIEDVAHNGSPNNSIHEASPDAQTDASQDPVRSAAANPGEAVLNASVTAENPARHAVIRRNVSTGSRRSRQAPNANTPSPVTPPPDSPYSPTGRATGVHRSNTLPSRTSQSPALNSARFQHQEPSLTITIPTTATPSEPPRLNQTPAQKSSPKSGRTDTSSAVPTASSALPQDTAISSRRSETPRLSPHLRPIPDKRASSVDRQLRNDMSLAAASSPSASGTPKEELRRPNKLQKKRPDNAVLGAKDSSASLSGTSHPPSPAHLPSVTDAQRLDSSASMLEQVNEQFELAPESTSDAGFLGRIKGKLHQSKE